MSKSIKPQATNIYDNVRQLELECTHRGGWPRIHPYDGWRARIAEAWWTLTGRFTLHSA
jgi:hypothetical protein